MSPTFSIIMTSYNYGRYVGTAIESVLGQSLPDWELLIVDDCSTDDSWEVISRYADPRIRAVRLEPNRGAAAAYNAVYPLATGEFIGTLDSDDVYHPDKLQRQKTFLDEHEDVGICGTYVEEIDATGKTVPAETSTQVAWFNGDRDLNDPANWIWQNRMCHSSVVLRKDLHDRLGSWNARLTYTPDWEFWFRALIDGARFHVIPEPLLRYRSHGGNITFTGERERMLEYADICARMLHAYLARVGRVDLIVSNVMQFLRQPPMVQASHEDAIALLDLICLAPFRSDDPSFLGGRAGGAVMTELALTLAGHLRWHDEQRQAWEQAARDLTAELAAQRARLEDRESAAQWHDQQRQAWERAAGELAAELAAQRARLQESEARVRWDDEQRQAGEQADAELRAMPPRQLLARALRQIALPQGSRRSTLYGTARRLLRRMRGSDAASQYH